MGFQIIGEGEAEVALPRFPSLPSSSPSVAPGSISVQMLGQVHSAVLEFVSGKSDAVQVGAHGELPVFGLHRARTRAGLRKRLAIEGEGEYDVGADLPSVESGVEAAELDRVVPVRLEVAVEVQEMVAASVVMTVSGAVAAIPYPLHVGHVGGADALQALQHLPIGLSAPLLPRRIKLEGVVQEVFLGGDNLDEVLEAAYGMRCPVQVDVDTACVSAAGEGPRFAKLPHHFLQIVDVLPVPKRRAHELHFVGFWSFDVPPVHLSLGMDAGVADDFPGAVLAVLNDPLIKVTPG